VSAAPAAKDAVVAVCVVTAAVFAVKVLSAVAEPVPVAVGTAAVAEADWREAMVPVDVRAPVVVAV